MRFRVSAAVVIAVLTSGPMQVRAQVTTVTSLDDGRSGKIAFESPTPKSVRDLVCHSAMDRAMISGFLSLPEKAAGPVPAMVILHGSGGISGRESIWAQRMNDLGYAACIVDSFTGREKSPLAVADFLKTAFAETR